jgi:hypothetical protein
MAKSLSDYLTICFEVLTQVREGSARSRETEKERREKREKEQSHRPSFFSSSFDLDLLFQKTQKTQLTTVASAPPPPLRASHRRDRWPHRGADLHRDGPDEVKRKRSFAFLPSVYFPFKLTPSSSFLSPSLFKLNPNHRHPAVASAARSPRRCPGEGRTVSDRRDGDGNGKKKR